MQDGGIVPALPDNPLPYLIGWLFEIGPTVSTGMGMTVIGWEAIAHWQAIMGIELLPWEARMLRRLSGEHLSQFGKSEAPDCPAPFGGKASDPALNREEVSKKVNEAFRGLMGVTGKRG